MSEFINTPAILDQVAKIIAILSAVALPVSLGFYFAIKLSKAKHQERMELIRQGIAPSGQSKSMPNRYRSLRNGCLCIGIGLGLVVGFVVNHSMHIGEDDTFWVFAASVLLFLGIGYIVFYVITNKVKEQIDDTID